MGESKIQFRPRRSPPPAPHSEESTRPTTAVAPTPPPNAAVSPPSNAFTHPIPTLSIRVDGLTCQGCIQTATRTLLSHPNVQSLSPLGLDGHTTLQLKGVLPSEESTFQQLKTDLHNAGYDSHRLESPPQPQQNSAANPWTKSVWIGAPASLVLLVGGLFPSISSHPIYPWIQFAIAAFVQAALGLRFYRGAWNQAKARQANMDTLVSLGSTTAFLFSAVSLFTHSKQHLFFSEGVLILSLISIGHWLESKMSDRASRSLRDLLELAPPTARRLKTGSQPVPTSTSANDSQPAFEEVPVATLSPGNVLALSPGDKVPVDCLVLSGASSIDESSLSGEPIPVDKSIGARLFAGTLVLDGQLTATVQAVGNNTVLAGIIASVQRAQNTRAQIQRLADRISSIFVPIVVLIAFAAALFWYFFPNAASALHQSLAPALWHSSLPATPAAAAITIFCSVVIIACPCAMGLATPAALMAGVGAAARRGILIRDALALEKSGALTAIAFDKTGTLTLGQPKPVDFLDLRPPAQSPQPPSLPSIVANLARPSQHPLSRALSQWSEDSLPVQHWQERRGQGIEGTIGNAQHRLGSLAWLLPTPLSNPAATQPPHSPPIPQAQNFIQHWASQGATLIAWTQDQQLAGLIALSDTLRPDAALALTGIAQHGRSKRKLYLVSGDAPTAVNAIAKSLEQQANGRLQFTEIHGGVSPEGKAKLLESLQNQGERVAFVGDGINDAPALAQANLGIGVGTASDIARENADVILLRPGIHPVLEALDIADATLRIIRQNLFWAFFYNAAAVPLAALGFMSPVLCAAAMGFSDLIVIGNALRLRRMVFRNSTASLARG